jgi:two-component system, OmpR family, response regulator VicR
MESIDWVNLSDKKILVVDDEKDITDLIEEVLHKDGFHKVLKAYTGLDAIKVSRGLLPDAIILDIMLPDIDGIEICKKIREFSFCPIMFLSSKNDDIDKILGLSSGGDDYVTKPFSPREIVFRVKAQLRRKRAAIVSMVLVALVWIKIKTGLKSKIALSILTSLFIPNIVFMYLMNGIKF